MSKKDVCLDLEVQIEELPDLELVPKESLNLLLSDLEIYISNMVNAKTKRKYKKCDVSTKKVPS